MASMTDYESYDAFDVMGVDQFGQLVSLGAKKGTFRMPAPLAMVEAAPKYETLPTETLKTRYLKPITKTTYRNHTHTVAQASREGGISSTGNAARNCDHDEPRVTHPVPLNVFPYFCRQLHRPGHHPAQDHHPAGAAAAISGAADHPHSSHQTAHPTYCHQQELHPTAPHVRPPTTTARTPSQSGCTANSSYQTHSRHTRCLSLSPCRLTAPRLRSCPSYTSRT